MKIENVIEEIMNIRKEIQKRTNTYIYEIDYTSIIDDNLNAQANILMVFLKKNELIEYYNLLNSLLPIQGNAIEFVETLASIKEELLEFNKYNNPQSRLKMINELSSHLQMHYSRTEIDCLFSSLDIKCGDDFYTCNSKRIYAQNVLQKATTSQLINLSKSESMLTDIIDIHNDVCMLSNDFIDEQIEKCNKKVGEKDYDGAITNARTLLEETLLFIESKIIGNRLEYDGNLMKLYKRVGKKLNLEPNDKNTENSLNEILRGFASIISGLSAISNNSSDRHAQNYKPDKRHANLCVNASFTICKFLFESYVYQYENKISL